MPIEIASYTNFAENVGHIISGNSCPNTICINSAFGT